MSQAAMTKIDYLILTLLPQAVICCRLIGLANYRCPINLRLIFRYTLTASFVIYLWKSALTDTRKKYKS